jgi:hypothetical protein
MNDSIRARPASGLPSAAALAARDAIYGGSSSEPDDAEDYEYEEPGEAVEIDVPTPNNQHSRSAAPTKESQFAKAFGLLLGGKLRLCGVKINKVGLSIPVLDYVVSENAVCLILKDVGWVCDWPLSEDVVLTLPDGRIFKATYLGGFHQFKEIGIQIVWFVLVESAEVSQSGIDAQRPTA